MNKINAFLEFVWDRKIWLLSTGLLIACCKFIWWDFSTIVPDLRTNIRAKEEIERTIEEAKQVEDIFARLKNQMVLFGAVLTHYETNFGGKVVINDKARAAVEGVNLCMNIRRELASDIGRVEGLLFNAMDYKEFVQAQLQSMHETDVLIQQFSEFFGAAQRSPTQVGNVEADELVRTYNRVMNAMVARMKTSGDILGAAEDKRADRMEDIYNEFTVRMRWFWFALVPVIYVIAYVVIAIRSFQVFRIVRQRRRA